MPKSSKYLLFFSYLFIPLFLLAQTVPLKSQVKLEPNTKNSYELILNLNTTSQITQGFVLTFFGKTKVFPLSIALNGQNLWLKKSAQKPNKKNTVHWFYSDSNLVVQFNHQDVKTGDKLSLNLHLARNLNTMGQISLAVFSLQGELQKNVPLNKIQVQLPK